MPKPEFCIATSIATVFFTSIGNLKKLAIKNPKKRPIKLCNATATRIFQERLLKLSILIEKIIPIIKAIEISENNVKNFNKVFSLFLIKIFISIPHTTGRKTIKNVDLIKLRISISIFSSANKKIKAGVKKTVAIEVAMQNSGLGMTLALMHFTKLVALPSALFSLWHNISASGLVYFWKKK